VFPSSPTYLNSIETAFTMENEMISLSNITAGLVLGLVVTSALPALGASRAVPPGHNARAQAITQGIDGDGTVSPNRARALRECNDRIGGLREHAWGVSRQHVYRACMAERGEVE
jgi:hypothetical protein